MLLHQFYPSKGVPHHPFLGGPREAGYRETVDGWVDANGVPGKLLSWPYDPVENWGLVVEQWAGSQGNLPCRPCTRERCSYWFHCCLEVIDVDSPASYWRFRRWLLRVLKMDARQAFQTIQEVRQAKAVQAGLVREDQRRYYLRQLHVQRQEGASSSALPV